MSAEWRKVNLICSLNGKKDGIDVVQQPMPPMRSELLALFKRDELKKYYTEQELAQLPEEVSA
jgi:succinate dehydrogenase / fumarate reductase flavoprotein subunit